MEQDTGNPGLDLNPLIGQACALDTETTGTNPKIDRVISFGYVELIEGKVGKTVEWFFNPGATPIHPDAERVHGLTAEFLADKPPIKAFLPKIIELVVDMVVCGHNVKFDIQMLNAELARHRLPPLDKYIAGAFDTMKESRKRWPGKPATLDALCSRLGVPLHQREKHGALVDAMLCVDAIFAMNRGQQSLLDQVDAGASSINDCGEEKAPMPQVIVQAANEQELQDHDKYLAQLRAEGSEPIWPQEDGEDATCGPQQSMPC